MMQTPAQAFTRIQCPACLSTYKVPVGTTLDLPAVCTSSKCKPVVLDNPIAEATDIGGVVDNVKQLYHTVEKVRVEVVRQGGEYASLHTRLASIEGALNAVMQGLGMPTRVGPGVEG